MARTESSHPRFFWLLPSPTFGSVLIIFRCLFLRYRSMWRPKKTYVSGGKRFPTPQTAATLTLSDLSPQMKRVKAEMTEQEGSKLGAVAPRHAPDAPEEGDDRCSTLAREALRPPVASLQSRGRFAAALHPTTKGRSCPLDTRPTLRGLDARQRRVPLLRQSGFRARHHEQGRSRPLHPGKVLFALDPNHPCAGWMRGNGVSRCIDSQAFAPDTTSRGVPSPCTPTKGRSCPLDTRPTLRGLDARHRHVPLHRQSGAFAPPTPCRPMHYDP